MREAEPTAFGSRPRASSVLVVGSPSVSTTEEMAAVPPRALRGSARARHHTRRAVRAGAPELRTLAKFVLVGGSGYLVNLLAFAATQSLGVHHLLAATFAFLAAVLNNFHWNRRWTFRAVGAEALHRQARRFFIVSVAGFLLALLILQLLVDAGATPLVAQAVAIAAATPLGFLGNRLWTFA